MKPLLANSKSNAYEIFLSELGVRAIAVAEFATLGPLLIMFVIVLTYRCAITTSAIVAGIGYVTCLVVLPELLLTVLPNNIVETTSDNLA